MKACVNCHQRKPQLNAKGLCEDCHDGISPDTDFEPVYDFNAGKKNSERMVMKK